MSIAITLAVACFAFAAYIAFRWAGSGRIITAPEMYLIFFLGYLLVPSLYLAIADRPSIAGVVIVKEGGTQLLLAESIALFAFGIGVAACGVLIRMVPRRDWRFFQSSEWKNDLCSPVSSTGLLTFFLIGSAFAAVFFTSRGVPMLAILSVNQSDGFFRVMSEVRADSMAGAGYLMQGITIMLPIGALMYLARAIEEKSLAMICAAAIGTMLTIAAMASLSSRGHYAMFMILLFLVGQILIKGFRLRWVFIGVFAFLVLFAVSSLARFGSLSQYASTGAILQVGIEILLHRLSLGAQQAHALMSIFGTERDFLYGASYLWDATALLPGADVGFNRWAFNLTYPRSSVPSNLTPTFVGELFANFGYAGVFVGSALMGGLLQFAHFVQMRFARNSSSVVFFIVAWAYLSKSVLNGLGAMFEPLVATVCSYILFIAIRWTIHAFAATGLAQSNDVSPLLAVK